MSPDASIPRPARPKIQPVPQLPELPPDATLLEELLWTRKLADGFQVMAGNDDAIILDLLDVVDSYPDGRLRWKRVMERNRQVDALVERVSRAGG